VRLGKGGLSPEKREGEIREKRPQFPKLPEKKSFPSSRGSKERTATGRGKEGSITQKIHTDQKKRETRFEWKLEEEKKFL